MVQQVDLVVRNGKVVDGTGQDAFVADVAVHQGVIVGLGPRLSKFQGAREVDAAGKIVTPGWVDIHTHLDGQMTWDPSLEPLTGNGVTTVVTGNCGVGFAPCKKDQRRFLMECMEGVEDIPLGSMEAGINWQWESFQEFIGYLKQGSFGCDVACLVGHGPVRAYVLGERANLSDKPGGPQNDPVTADEIEKIAEVVRDAIAAGAIGFSTSRTLLHRDKSGTLVPGTLAAAEEMVAIGRAINEGGGGVFEMASDFMSYDDTTYTDEDLAVRLHHFAREWIWMHQISKGYKVPLCFCLGIPSQDTPQMNGFRHMLGEVEQARSDGCEMSIQVFVRPQGVIMCWDSRSHPFGDSPTFIELKKAAARAQQPIDKAELLHNQELKRKIVAETIGLVDKVEESSHFGIALPQSTETDDDLLDDGIGNLNGSVTGVGALAKMMSEGAKWIHKWESTYEPSEQDSALATAQRRGCHPLEVIYDWMCEEEGTRVVTHLFMNYSKSNLNDTYEMLTHPATIPGLGDAGAHLGFLCDATSHTYLLTHWVRDKKVGPKMTLEQAVKMHTHDTAMTFGMTDRGVLAVGKKADINVIDLDKLAIHAPKMEYDLPRGASRWTQRATGYAMTICNGVVTHENDTPNGALPGRFVENPRTFSNSDKPGAVSLAISNFKWEAKALGIKVLSKVVGANNLESFGYWLNSWPSAHAASKL